MVELVASVAAMSVLMGGIGSAMLLASHALPDGKASGDALLRGYRTAEQIVGELYCAETFTLRTATAVEFTVADRDDDASPETIRYEWSGTAGDPLTRRYNGATAVDVLPDAYEFDLTYEVTTTSETTTQTGISYVNDMLLASFDGWEGVPPTPKDTPVNVTNWVSEYFQVTGAPADATELVFTTANVMARTNDMAMPPDGMSVGIYRTSGGVTPAATPITADTGVFPISGMMYAWAEASFPGVTITDLADQEYCLVLKGVATTPFWAQYYYAQGAPADGMVQTWTSDGGGKWDPRASAQNKQDLRFYVYGSFTIDGTTEVTVDRYFVQAVRLALRAGTDTMAHLETDVQVLNAVEVASP